MADAELMKKPLHERHLLFAAACKAYREALPLTDDVIASLAEAHGVPVPKKPPPRKPPTGGGRGGLMFGDGNSGF